MNGQRGAVFVEFALSSLIVFAVLFGTLQLGIVGMEQIKADGAAYLGAHQSALSTATSMDPKTLVGNVYPNVNPGDMSFTPQPPPADAVVPNIYGTTQNIARHGGFSLMLPIQTVGTVVRNNIDNIVLGVTGSSISLTGVAYEPSYQEIGAHDDINGVTVNSAAAFAGRNDYFTQGENTPPYFVGFKYMHYCLDATAACSGSNVQFDALGLAEYLDVDNWSRATNGVTPGAVFSDMLAHQNVFAKLSATIAALTGGATPKATPDLSKISAALNSDPDISCMYHKWDSQTPGGYAVGGTSIGSFPLNPGAVCP